MNLQKKIVGEISDILGASSLEVKYGCPLSSISSFKIGGNAECVIYPNTEEALVSLIKLHEKFDLPYVIIGKTSNVLFLDGSHSETVICTARLRDFDISGRCLECSAGASLSAVGRALAENGLSGFEGLCGIPGTVGGAIYMNAGAFNCEISDKITSVRCYDKVSEKIVVLDREQLDFSYRKSIFMNDDRYIILSAAFFLPERPAEEIFADMNSCRQKRMQTQPLEYPSAGSVFKRPEGASAGALIDRAGFKGYSVGGAQVSEKHAGFIVNRGGATASEVLELVEIIKKRILELYGIALECEIEIK